VQAFPQTFTARPAPDAKAKRLRVNVERKVNPSRCPKEPPQAAPPWGRSYQMLSAGRLITADNTDMLSPPS